MNFLHAKSARLLACGGIVCSGIAFGQIYGRPQVEVYAPSPLLKEIGINQKLGAQVPVDLPFTDESGQEVTLQRYFGKPVILALVYYQCPSLCNMVLNAVLRSVKNLEISAGKEFEVVAVSFDPRETPRMAAAKKHTYLNEYNRPGAEQGWHFLTGPERSSKALAQSVGFRYVYDALTNQYAHGSAIMILTPAGRVTRYFYGINYPSRDVRLGLVEASSERIGTATDQVLLYCFHYDPSTGRYALVVMNVLRLSAIVTLGALSMFMIVMFRRDFRASRTPRGAA
jgi:protein SCO1/2